MKLYSVFDDYSNEAINILNEAGYMVHLHPTGKARPKGQEIADILSNYDGIIIGTGQIIDDTMLAEIDDYKIIATASIGVDHIKLSESNRNKVKIVNAPNANCPSVVEYIMGCILMSAKKIMEGNDLYRKGINNKALAEKPQDVSGKTLGIIGAGRISERTAKLAELLGMKVIYWTKHPDKHVDFNHGYGKYKSLDEIFEKADYVSVNLPNVFDTEKIISKNLIDKMKDNATLISISRESVIDTDAIIEKAKECPLFSAYLDIDINNELVHKISCVDNVIVTPHIAGGTEQSRKRMFIEAAENIVSIRG